jgi:hypothetical protein
MDFIFIKILGWESTVTIYIYIHGYCRFQMIACKFREADRAVYFFNVFYDIFSKYRKGTTLKSLVGVL